MCARGWQLFLWFCVLMHSCLLSYHDALTALGESSEDEAETTHSPAATGGGAGGGADSSGNETRMGWSERVRAGILEYKAGRDAASAAPTTSFVQKRQRSQVMPDEVSESFDPAKHAAIEKNVKAEKVRVM